MTVSDFHSDGLPIALPDCAERAWARRAIGLLRGDARRSADTHLIKPVFPGLKGISVYLKDESTHPTDSLKHRLARSLVLYGICNGHIHEGTTLVEASSGSTAVSEACFARILDLPFIAVMPRSTSRQKIAATERFGGRCRFVERSADVYDAAHAVAAETGVFDRQSDVAPAGRRARCRRPDCPREIRAIGDLVERTQARTGRRADPRPSPMTKRSAWHRQPAARSSTGRTITRNSKS